MYLRQGLVDRFLTSGSALYSKLSLDDDYESMSSPFSIIRTRSYLCCDPKLQSTYFTRTGLGASCTIASETSTYIVVHVTLHLSRVVGALLLIMWFNNKLKSSKAPHIFVSNVTNMYQLPPYYLRNVLPKSLRYLVSNMKMWSYIQIIAVVFMLYIVAIFQALVPIEWPKVCLNNKKHNKKQL